MIALPVGAIVSARRRVSHGSLMLCAAATLISGCAGETDEPDRQGARRPSSPPAATRPAPAPPIEFAQDGFRYTFAATGAGFSPTGDPANTSDPLPPGRTYLVMNGRLTNLQADRPAPRYPAADIGVSIPLTALSAVVTETIGSRGRCENLDLPVGDEPAHSLPGRRCLLVLNVSEPPSGDESPIPAAGSVQVTYVRRLPDKLPLNQFRLVAFQRGDRYGITSSHPVPWNPT